MYICDVHKSSLRFHCQRFSNNSNPEFTDEEVLTIYLFCGYCQRYFNIKEIHTFAKEYLSSWFPKLPSYQTFCGRLNMLSETFKVLVETMIQSFKPKDCDSIISIVDSMPIVTCKGKNREGKVATEITSKGYCSTKNMYYYGMKLHMVGQRREGTFPFPEMITLTPASDNDLTVFKSECVPYLSGKTVLADKTYSDFSFFNESNPVKVLTPHKEIKGEPEVLKQREKAARDLFSQAVSKVRQPIESFFNWLNEKTEIQRASKVRATKGLLVHTFGKLAIALLTFVILIFESESQLLIGINNKGMNTLILDFLNSYADNTNPQYAVMLKGKWGCGKTHLINEWKKRFDGTADTDGEITLKPIYISTYGMDSVNDIKTAIDRELNPFFYSKTGVS